VQNVDPYRKRSLMASVKTKFIVSYYLENQAAIPPAVIYLIED
jgi:hypothetical protein